MVTLARADKTAKQTMDPSSGAAALLTDAAGTRHSTADGTARIVSLVPSITELLFDLGLGAQVVGRTLYCIHPAQELTKVPSMGGTKKINLDRLKEVAPTHVIVNVDENDRVMVDAIRPLVPHVIVTHPIEPRDNLGLYRLLGGIFGRQQQAEELCERFDAAEEAVVAGAKNLGSARVLYLIWKNPWMTVSADTYISRLLATVGWNTVGNDPDTRYPEVEMSDGLLEDVDLVLFSSEPFEFTSADADEFNASHPQGPKALFVNGEMISWYGSRAIPGLGYLHRLAEDSAAK